MTEQKEDWIRIRKPNGQNWVVNPAYIQELLGIDKIEENRRVMHACIERRLEVLETPLRKEKLLKLLSDETKPRTSHWITGRVGTYQDISELEDEGKLVVTILPKSHRKMYSVKGE